MYKIVFSVFYGDGNRTQHNTSLRYYVATVLDTGYQNYRRKNGHGPGLHETWTETGMEPSTVLGGLVPRS